MALVDQEHLHYGQPSPVRDVIYPWLQNPSWTPRELWGFLQGVHLRNRPQGEAPWLSIYRALVSPEEERIPLEVQTAMTPRIAHLLQDQPDVRLKTPEPEIALENLFSLANAIGDPEFHPRLVAMVAEPLHDIFLRRMNGRGPLPTNCKEPFTLAVARTQVDGRYFPAWSMLAQGGRHHILGTPGGVFTGVEGLVRMPTDLENFGTPDISMVEFGLKHLADYLKQGKYPGSRDGFTQAEFFKQFVQESVMGPFPKHPNWPQTIGEMSGLPDWARTATLGTTGGPSSRRQV